MHTKENTDKNYNNFVGGSGKLSGFCGKIRLIMIANCAIINSLFNIFCQIYGETVDDNYIDLDHALWGRL